MTLECLRELLLIWHKSSLGLKVGQRSGSRWAHKTCFANHDEISLKCLVGEADNIKIFYIQKVKGQVCREVDLNSKSIGS